MAGIEPARPCGHEVLNLARLPISPHGLVPMTGVEPVRPCGHGDLNPARLPVSPHRHYKSGPASRTRTDVAEFRKLCCLSICPRVGPCQRIELCIPGLEGQDEHSARRSYSHDTPDSVVGDHSSIGRYPPSSGLRFPSSCLRCRLYTQSNIYNHGL